MVILLGPEVAEVGAAGKLDSYQILTEVYAVLVVEHMEICMVVDPVVTKMCFMCYGIYKKLEYEEKEKEKLEKARKEAWEDAFEIGYEKCRLDKDIEKECRTPEDIKAKAREAWHDAFEKCNTDRYAEKECRTPEDLETKDQDIEDKDEK